MGVRVFISLCAIFSDNIVDLFGPEPPQTEKTGVRRPVRNTGSVQSDNVNFIMTWECLEESVAEKESWSERIARTDHMLFFFNLLCAMSCRVT